MHLHVRLLEDRRWRTLCRRSNAARIRTRLLRGEPPPLIGETAHTMTWCWQWPSSAGMSSDHSQTGGSLISDWLVSGARKLVFDAFHLLLDSLDYSVLHGQGSAQCFAQQHRQSGGV